MMSEACREGLPVSCQCGVGEVGQRMAHGAATSAVNTSISCRTPTVARRGQEAIWIA